MSLLLGFGAAYVDISGWRILRFLGHVLWLYDLVRGVTTRFTFDSAQDVYPVWSPEVNREAMMLQSPNENR